MKKLFPFLCLLCLAFSGYAQNENLIWHFGRGCSIYFNRNGIAKTTATSGVPAHQFSQFIYKVATICDTRTGKLLFYTNGAQIINRNEQPMPNGNLVAGATDLVIVPDLLDSTMYFIFYTAPGPKLFYTRIDMKMNNGLGGIVYKNKAIQENVFHRFIVVKQLYGQGHWLIADSYTNDKFYAYRITGDSISKPVVSITGGPQRITDALDMQVGDMEATTDGNMFACTFKTAANDGLAGVYNFDKKCGTVTFNQQLDIGTLYYSLAFDHSSQFLYVSRSLNASCELLQFDLLSANPDQSEIVVATTDGYSPIEAMELGPDNRIYITTQQQTTGPGGGLSPAPTLHLVSRPWVKGTACGFVPKTIQLNPGGVQCQIGLACLITSNLPDFVSDRTIEQPVGFETPNVDVKNFCMGDQTLFNVTGNFIADSTKWGFGDGDSVAAKNVSHTYAAPGNYKASFKWYLCGFEYVKKVTVKMGPKPIVNLGEDSTLCQGAVINLKVPVLADEYKWSTGEATSSIIVKMPGAYGLTVRNGDCYGSDEVKIEYYPSIWTALGDEYFICNDEKELTKLDAGEGFVNYKWTPTGDTTQWIEVANLGEYFVVVKDFRGCKGEDGTKVKRRCPVKVYFPNAFTPNSDGLNDVFEPIGKDVTVFKMTVYNSWGEIVFVTNDISYTWDGTHKGKAAPAGVYIYKAYYEGYRNKKIMNFDEKGNVTLLR